LRAPRSLLATGTLPALLLLGLWWVLQHVPRWRAVLAVAALTSVAVLIAPTLAAWRSTPFTDARIAMFAPWRAIIPVGTEVLWFDNPTASWILLQRPNYISNQQTASSIFSRAAAVTSITRLYSLREFLSAEPEVAWRAPMSEGQQRAGTLAALCASAPVKFVVTRHDLSATPLTTAPEAAGTGFAGLKLYGCGAQPPLPGLNPGTSTAATKS